MLKRLYSKKSGFTLVEIVVAFAIFSIMAVMICQLLMMVLNQRDSNRQFAKETAEQEETLITKGKNTTYSGSADGTMNFSFADGTKFGMNYQTKEADGSHGTEGLNYFIVDKQSNTSGNGALAGDSSSSKNDNAMTGETDTRISGTKGFDYIIVSKVVKDTSYKGEGCRYFFEVTASAAQRSASTAGTGNMWPDDLQRAQYRLFFYDDEKLDSTLSSTEYTDPSDNNQKYTKNVYKSGKIKDGGYLTNSVSDTLSVVGNNSDKSLEARGLSMPFISGNNSSTGIEVSISGNNGVRVGITLEKGKEKPSMFPTSIVSFYLVFEDKDFKITTSSFGLNGSTWDSSLPTSIKYTKSPVYLDYKYDSDKGKIAEGKDLKGNTVSQYHECIYGSFPYKIIPVSGG